MTDNAALPPFSLDAARTTLALLQAAIGNYDSATGAEADARITYEMLTENPSLGSTQRITADDAKARLDSVSAQRLAARAVVLKLTGAASIDDARAALLDATAAYNHVSLLTEIMAGVAVGDADAVAAAEKRGADLHGRLADAQQALSTRLGAIRVPETASVLRLVKPSLLIN